jgi:hypothetical protein
MAWLVISRRCPGPLSPHKTLNYLHYWVYLQISIAVMSGDYGSWTSRRKLWIPSDSKSYYQGEKVVFRVLSGIVTIADFSGVITARHSSSTATVM